MQPKRGQLWRQWGHLGWLLFHPWVMFGWLYLYSLFNDSFFSDLNYSVEWSSGEWVMNWRGFGRIGRGVVFKYYPRIWLENAEFVPTILQNFALSLYLEVSSKKMIQIKTCRRVCDILLHQILSHNNSNGPWVVSIKQSTNLWHFRLSRRRVWSSESSGMYCPVLNWMSTDISKVHAATIIRAMSPAWWWRQQAPLKRRSTSN
jgi:hypothetical protein